MTGSPTELAVSSSSFVLSQEREVNLKPGLNLPDKEDDLTCLVGLRTAWILRGQWGSRLPGEAQGRECNEDQGPEPGKSMVY